MTNSPTTTSPSSKVDFKAVANSDKAKVTTVGPGLDVGPVFVGIDASLTKWSATLYQGSGAYQGYLIQPKEKGPARLAHLYFCTKNLLMVAGIYGNVERVLMEGYAFGVKGSRSHSIGEGGGVTKLAIHHAGIPLDILPPSSLKKFVTSKGNAAKNEMMLGVYKQWGVEFSDDNLADSYALARAAYHIDNAPTLKYQAEALQKVEQG